MYTKIPLALVALVSALVYSGCTTNARRTESSALRNDQSRGPTASPSSVAASPIRVIDFDNISYPNFPDYSDRNGREKKYITLKPREGGPNFLSYGDITGDGLEEAMVAMGIENRGSAIPYFVYIFTIEDNRPRIIWSFEAGDRADGGLRQVFAQSGQLVVELFGKNRVIGGDLYKGNEGLCCPTSFTRTSYRWTGSRFAETSREVVANPSRDANPVMPRYQPKN